MKILDDWTKKNMVISDGFMNLNWDSSQFREECEQQDDHRDLFVDVFGQHDFSKLKNQQNMCLKCWAVLIKQSKG